MKIRHLAAAALALGLSACAAQSSAVSIYAICAPPAPDTATGGCLYPATCDASLANTPLLDARTATLDFRLPVQLNNLLTDNANPAEGRVNSNDAFVQSLEITYSGGSVAPWNPLIAVTVPTAGSAGTLFSLIRVQDFPAFMPSSPAATNHISISVRAHGILASQDSFTTAWFQIPVDVCDGCLASVGLTCTAPAFPAYCPSSATFGPPGQTANAACVTPN